MTTVSTLPLDLGTIHFVGIGGIGMSGIAEILHSLGYDVQGSDMAEGANVVRLREKGIPVSVGHKAENIGEAAVVVVSTAVKPDNPEVVAARARLTPVVRRAEMLGELMRLKWAIAVGGTHGKTTTTSMIAALLDHAGIDPTVVNGGIINAYGTNARLGDGDWMVVEADESRRQLHQAARHHRGRHQHRPRAHGFLRQTKKPCIFAFETFVEQHPLLRLRGALHRPSGGAER